MCKAPGELRPKSLVNASLQRIALLLCCVVLVACGGGGGGGAVNAIVPVAAAPPSSDGGTDDDNDGSNDSTTPEPLRGIYAAARLGSRATFGADLDAINSIDALGEEAWIEEQFQLPLSSHDAVVDALVQREEAGDFAELGERDAGLDLSVFFGRAAWWQTTVSAPDQLRQRVAYALSQIFVISDQVNELLAATYGTSNYYDTLLSHAFGNYRDLLHAVTLHPSMGLYLSHLNNAKSDPQKGTFPDENYAREVMQLFSIGLFELREDGSEKLDAEGRPIATYDNNDIREFAKMFTGLSWGGFNNRFASDNYNFRAPMRMFEGFHETGEKILLGGEVVPAGQGGSADIESAVDNLFEHPNVGPFIGKQLIQRLVSSNPSPAYIERVSAAFNGDSSGVRGDMQAVIKAILLDPEARALPDPATNRGKLREPLVRYIAMLRQLGVTAPDGFYANLGLLVQSLIQQHPLSAPSVFNFYLPNHQPIGEIARQGLLAPEFQITNSNSVVEISNLMQFAVIGAFVNDLQDPPFSVSYLDFADFQPLSGDINALLDRLDTVFTYGTLSVDTRESIAELLVLIDDEDLRVRVAAYLLLISPDYAVEL